MRFGSPIFRKCTSPAKGAAAVREKGYSAAQCPLEPDAEAATIASYESGARKAGIVIAEV